MADTTDYPYSTVPNRLGEVLGKIPSIGTPEKASQDWLKGLGYTSGNDKSILTAMRKAGIVGSSGTPTEFYMALRNKDGTEIAGHVRAAYRELFALYPDAHHKDDEALRNFFRSKTTSGDKVQSLMVRTFKVLAERADFGGVSPSPTVPSLEAKAAAPAKAAAGSKAPQAGTNSLTLNVNIQLQLPPSAEGDVYEKLFAAMGKHLKGLATLE